MVVAHKKGVLVDSTEQEKAPPEDVIYIQKKPFYLSFIYAPLKLRLSSA